MDIVEHENAYTPSSQTNIICSVEVEVTEYVVGRRSDPSGERRGLHSARKGGEAGLLSVFIFNNVIFSQTNKVLNRSIP